MARTLWIAFSLFLAFVLWVLFCMDGNWIYWIGIAFSVDIIRKELDLYMWQKKLALAQAGWLRRYIQGTEE